MENEERQEEVEKNLREMLDECIAEALEALEYFQHTGERIKFKEWVEKWEGNVEVLNEEFVKMGVDTSILPIIYN